MAGRKTFRLQDYWKGSDGFHFEYIPTEVTESREAEYEEQETEGDSVEDSQYGRGKPGEMRFMLFLNEWGNLEVARGSVDDTINWLMSKMLPSRQTTETGEGQSEPPLMQLIIPPKVYAGYLTNIEVRRKQFRPRGGGTVRAEVDITFREYKDSKVPGWYK